MVLFLSSCICHSFYKSIGFSVDDTDHKSEESDAHTNSENKDTLKEDTPSQSSNVVSNRAHANSIHSGNALAMLLDVIGDEEEDESTTDTSASEGKNRKHI